MERACSQDSFPILTIENQVNGKYGSILGGYNHGIDDTSGTARQENFNNTNATAIQTVPHHHPEDCIAALEDHSPLNCTAEEGWCKSEKKCFLFTEGVVIGRQNTNCAYGRASLAVDRGTRKKGGTNCPSGKGSVTFGPATMQKKHIRSLGSV